MPNTLKSICVWGTSLFSRVQVTYAAFVSHVSKYVNTHLKLEMQQFLF